MDLTSLAFILVLAMTAVGTDTALHPVGVVLNAAVPVKLEKLTADAEAIDQLLNYEVGRIAATPSVLAVPEVNVGGQRSLGLAIARAANLESVALALQAELGYQPTRIRLTLLSQDGAIRMLVTGSDPGGRIDTPPFEEQVTLQPNETLASLVHRATLAAFAKIDPYKTALYLLQSHASDGDFSELRTLIDDTKAQLPPTPVNFDRSLFENLQGIFALFRNKPEEARDWFHRATLSDPNNAVAAVNEAFADLQLDRDRVAAETIETLVTTHPPTDALVLATAYTTWAAALMGVHDVNGADAKLAKSVEINPTSATAYELWSDIKLAKGDAAAAARLHTRALELSDVFENYAELATLYFQLAWQKGQPIIRSQFTNPEMIRYN